MKTDENWFVIEHAGADGSWQPLARYETEDAARTALADLPCDGSPIELRLVRLVTTTRSYVIEPDVGKHSPEQAQQSP